ncbi:MAG: 16S rRNA (guanine(966)-N(2))-methyltransferase RsmD [Simkaniaceae bacterium]|nr:MAG: 16S rRNA (guanine(966)-N(2))-methyltransferase RsmD [Simkaniaceae bacterium]
MRITGGFLKNQSLKTPKGDKTRPTSEKLRQSVFNIAQAYVDNCAFLDLFAGSGAMGIEALSRGAKEATFIEKNRAALKVLRENLQDHDLLPLSTLLAGDVLTLLKKLKGNAFDLIYVDPPYEKGLQEKTLVLIDHLHLLHIGGLLFIEESSQNELKIPPLTNIELKKKRKVGSTSLYEFIGKL